MAYISHHLMRTVRAAKFAGGFSIVVFLVAVGLILSVSPDSQVGRPAQWSTGTIIIFCGVGFLLQGILLWVFASRLEAGKFWAFFPIALLALLDLSKVFLLLCSFWTIIPSLYLLGCCINSFSDVRDHYRQKRRAREPRGFEPILTAPAPKKRPPPPARSKRVP